MCQNCPPKDVEIEERERLFGLLSPERIEHPIACDCACPEKSRGKEGQNWVCHRCNHRIRFT